MTVCILPLHLLLIIKGICNYFMNLKREKLSDSNSLQASDLSSIDDASIDKNNIYLESESDRSS